MRINRHDTNGTKPLLSKGELGYDDYAAGGDTGRAYVGTGTENIALAKRIEANTMTKAQFNALAEERKANRAGSGFDEWGKHLNNGTSIVNVNEGIFTVNNAANANTFYLGDSVGIGVSKTVNPITNINGTRQSIAYINNTGNSSNKVFLPVAPNIYPYDTVLTAEQIASGVIKHADASNSGLIVNGKFDVDTSGWINTTNSTLSVDSNKLKITLSAFGSARQTINTVVGKKYIIEAYITSNTTTTRLIAFNSSEVQIVSGTANILGRNILEFTATTTTSRIDIYSDTSGVILIDNIAVYPADAISRSDLSMAESFHEDIAEKGFGYPLGNTQYLGGNTDGLTGITNGAFTGFETYSLFGNWQTSSALIGKGYVWSSLTEAQKKAFIANPDNNCYLDGDKVIQVRYRIRVVQGLGDNWINITTDASLRYDSNINNVALKGKLASITSDFVGDGSARFITYAATVAVAQVSIGSFAPYNSINSAYEGKCFALPIALVHRRNQGMYHPVYNPNGTKKASDGNFWYNTAVSFTSISDCFDPAKLLTASGYIGTVSGRPDGLFYDQVHEGDILDLRNSSKKVEDYNRLINREFNKLVAGTTRGKEGEWDSKIYNVTSTIYTMRQQTTTEFYFYLKTVQGSTLPITISEAYDLIGKSVYITTINGAFIGYIYKVDSSQLYVISISNTAFVSGVGSYNIPYTITIGAKSTRTKSNTLLHCDIIGNPTNYPTSWKQSGVFGTPLIVAEDGTSLLPDGARDSFKLSRKANATPLLCLRSTDNGVTWTSFTPTFSTTTNAITLTDEPATNLVMVYYQTHTSMAVPAVNSEVLEIGEVFSATYGSSLQLISILVASLLGKITTNNSVSNYQIISRLNEYSKYTTANNLLSNTASYFPTHNQIQLGAVSSPAVKVFPYLTRLNGKAYLNLVFKEMKYGSYLTPTTVTAASATYTQNLTYKINIAGCALDGKVIKWIGTTTTSAIDWSLYDVSPTGVIYLLSTGVVYANAKLYDGDSWGDDSKFNIVDNVSTTTDDNGQTVLIGQKTVELPYFIGADE